jgi:hypothetical protein
MKRNHIILLLVLFIVVLIYATKKQVFMIGCVDAKRGNEKWQATPEEERKKHCEELADAAQKGIPWYIPFLWY